MKNKEASKPRSSLFFAYGRKWWALFVLLSLAMFLAFAHLSVSSLFLYRWELAFVANVLVWAVFMGRQAGVGEHRVATVGNQENPDYSAVSAAITAGQLQYKRQLRQLQLILQEHRAGLAEVSSDYVVTEIDGRALSFTGARRRDWLGKELNHPRYRQAVARGLAGKVTTFRQSTPGKMECMQTVQYAPRHDSVGAVNGVSILWIIEVNDE